MIKLNLKAPSTSKSTCAFALLASLVRVHCFTLIQRPVSLSHIIYKNHHYGLTEKRKISLNIGSFEGDFGPMDEGFGPMTGPANNFGSMAGESFEQMVGESFATEVKELTSDFAVEIAERVQDSVAIITPIGPDNKTALGTGFLVNFARSLTYNDLGGAESLDALGEFVSGEGEEEHLFLLTAAHVAAPGYKVQVRFPAFDDIQPVPAKVIGRQMTTDLALLRVSRSDLYPYIIPPSLKITSETQVGELAFACGFPTGLLTSDGPAVTMGIVCGKAPGLSSSSSTPAYEENNVIDNVNVEDSIKPNLQTSSKTMFIVTDAAMAGGMSGGPLVNSNGEIIGMNCLVRADLRALGNYAISSSTIIPFLKRLQKLYYEKMNESVYGNSIGGMYEEVAQVPEVVQEPIRDAVREPPEQKPEYTPPPPPSEKYRVILYKFNPNKREAVIGILKNMILCDKEEAEKLIDNASTQGYAIVNDFQKAGAQNRESAFALCNALRQENLLVEVEKTNI